MIVYPAGSSPINPTSSHVLAAVPAAGEQVLLRPVVVDGVPAGAVVPGVPGAEPDEDLVAPGPQPVVGRPPAEPPRLGVDLDVAGHRRPGRRGERAAPGAAR